MSFPRKPQNMPIQDEHANYSRATSEVCSPRLFYCCFHGEKQIITLLYSREPLYHSDTMSCPQKHLKLFVSNLSLKVCEEPLARDKGTF